MMRLNQKAKNNEDPWGECMMELLKKINMIKEIIVENYHPNKIILFDSYARGDFDEQSAIDLLVISNRENDLPRYGRGWMFG